MGTNDRYTQLVSAMTDHGDSDERGVEFFGARLKVNSPRLAALLNSSVSEDVTLIGRRTIELLARADEEDGLETLEDRAADLS